MNKEFIEEEEKILKRVAPSRAPILTDGEYQAKVLEAIMKEVIFNCCICDDRCPVQNERYFVCPGSIAIWERFFLCDAHKNIKLSFDMFYTEDGKRKVINKEDYK